MPISIRYTDIRNGGIVMTGNTLGLSKSANANAPGQLGSIGAFTSLNLSLQVGNFPPGTTLDYTQNGSSAQLNLPAGSGILHAELIWGGLYRSTVNDISGILNQSVLFTAPDGAHTVAPDPATAENFVITTSGVTVGFYVRSADVTSIVAGALGGTYSTQRVPALIEALGQAKADRGGKPHAFIARTVKGKGVSFMEGQAGWHGKAPNAEQLVQALADLGYDGGEEACRG